MGIYFTGNGWELGETMGTGGGGVEMKSVKWVADSDWGCFRGCAISSSLGAPF